MKSFQIFLLNNIFVQTGFNFKSVFRNALGQYFKAIPQKLNFADSANSASRINSWIREKTKGRIQKLFAEGMSVS